MVFVEVLRLMLVIAGVIAGLQIGDHVGGSTSAPLAGVTLGALVSYVVGGVAGRTVDRGLRGAVRRLDAMPPAEVFAGSVVGTTGLLAGLAFGYGMLSFVRSDVAAPLCAAVAWVLCAAGVRLGVAKGQQIARVAGLTRLVERPHPAPEGALVLDTSALLERHVMVLGRAGLLSGPVVVPRVVLDEAHALLDGPDPVSSRRARAGLEALDALADGGVTVEVEESEVPEASTPGDKALVLAQRLGARLVTCAHELAARAELQGVAVLDLRQLSGELGPQHRPGERLEVELVKPGRQHGQAVGYLPDGDMVVVNGAAHLVGQRVPVLVASARPTSQGVLVFAGLAAS